MAEREEKQMDDHQQEALSTDLPEDNLQLALRRASAADAKSLSEEENQALAEREEEMNNPLAFLHRSSAAEATSISGRRSRSGRRPETKGADYPGDPHRRLSRCDQRGRAGDAAARAEFDLLDREGRGSRARDRGDPDQLAFARRDRV